MLTVLDEYTREALYLAVWPKMNAQDVLEALYPLLMKHGKPEFIRSDNRPEFMATPRHKHETASTRNLIRKYKNDRANIRG